MAQYLGTPGRTYKVPLAARCSHQERDAGPRFAHTFCTPHRQPRGADEPPLTKYAIALFYAISCYDDMA